MTNHLLKYVAVLSTLLFCYQHSYASEPPVKLYVFDCGLIKMDTVAAFGINDDETDVRELVVPCYVIQHEKGLMLWDGGLPSSFAGSANSSNSNGMGMSLEKTLSEQLTRINMDLASFDFVAFSHMHLDHIGVANEITNATLLIQKAEYEAAFAEEVTVPAFDPELYRGLLNLDKKLLTGRHDVFGDERVIIIPAPGHTPGHQVLFIDLADYGPLVLSGDLYHFRISRTQRKVPTFNVDPALTLKSMESIENFIKDSGATLWIEHDMALFKELNKAPMSYQ